MMVLLTCALCAATTTTAMSEGAGPAPSLSVLENGSGLARVPQTPPGGSVPLALAHTMNDQRSGDGDHSDHMGPMWIVMGAMMAVMVVGMGVYLMRHSATGRTLAVGHGASPALLAVPVGSARPGGG